MLNGRAVAIAWLCLVGAGQASESCPAFWQVVRLSTDGALCLRGRPAEQVAVLACRKACRAIPWQLDERDTHGRMALDAGPHPNPDDPPGVVDANDELLWMLEDAGRRMRPEEAPPRAECGLEVHLRQGACERWAYAFAMAGPAPRSPRRYVHYDAGRDLMTGARVAMGFGGATPQYLALRSPDGRMEENLLDRLKIRASARFLGIFPVGRDEGDIQTRFVAWRAGPIRAIRRQRQWVELGWGWRTPMLRSEVTFYRDFAELPVHLRLNFPPTFLFRAFEVRAIMDFRDLRGWRLIAPGLAPPVEIGKATKAERTRLNRAPGEWFALRGPDVTLVQMLDIARTLAPVTRRLLYREETRGHGPESVRGELPGVGYRLTGWEDVDRGAHWFSAISYALPPAYDPNEFLRHRNRAVVVESHPFPEVERRPAGGKHGRAGGGFSAAHAER